MAIIQAPTAYSPAQAATPDTLAQAQIPQADIKRKEDMEHAWRAYRGEFQDQLKVELGKPNDNVNANRCAPIVNKGVSFLFGPVLKIECDDQDFVDGFWGDDDERMTLMSQLAINGGVCGQVFVKLIPAEYNNMKYPRPVILDPQIVRIVTHPEDCNLILAYIIEYPMAGDYQKRQIIFRVDPDNDALIAGSQYDIEDTWQIVNYLRKGSTDKYVQVGDPEIWPYPFAPILTSQNLPNPNEIWGIPDLTHDLIRMNKVLNFMLSNISRIIKHHGHPKTFVIGTNPQSLNVGVDEVIILPSPESKIESLAPMENFSGLLSVTASLRDDMDEQSRVPAVALGRLEALPKGNISGVALQLLFQPLIEKTVQKQRLYGKLIREVTRAAMVVAGKLSIEEYEDYDVDLHWQNLLPVDDLAAAQTSLILKQIGVSDQTIMAQLGYDADDEMEKSADEDQQKMVAFSRGQGMPPNMPGMMQPGQQQPGQESPFMNRGQ